MKTLVLIGLVSILAACMQQAPGKITLVGLDQAQVEKRIGAPDEKDDLADSDEAYWIYKTQHGTLTVHFQNRLVVSYSPDDFPLEKIIK